MNTLEECLSNYVKPTTLDEKNKWFCEKCKRHSQAEKKMSIWTTAEYLIISYKRYVNILLAPVKDDHSIKAPFYELDMSLYVEDNKKGQNIYDLSSVAIHSGNMKNGHYVMIRKIEDTWVLFNDNAVVPVKESDINHEAAYYLVYKRR